LAALLHPGPQAIPPRVAGLRSQSGQEPPRLLLAGLPAGQHGAVQPPWRAGTGGAPPLPAGTALRDDRGQWAHTPWPRRPKGPTRVAAQTRMPAPWHEASKPPGRLQAAIGQDDHRPGPRPQAPQPAPAAAPRATPRGWRRGREEDPRHGERTAPIDHPARHDDQARPQGGGSERQGPWGPLPPAHAPPQQRRKAGLALEGLALGAPFGGRLVLPLPPLLAYRGLFPVLDGCHDGADRRQGACACQPHAQAPQGQDRGRGLAQRGHRRHDSRLPLGHTGLAMQGFPPWHCGFSHAPQYASGREAMSHCQKSLPF
jgi:hypothetical protein